MKRKTLLLIAIFICLVLVILAGIVVINRINQEANFTNNQMANVNNTEENLSKEEKMKEAGIPKEYYNSVVTLDGITYNAQKVIDFFYYIEYGHNEEAGALEDKEIQIVEFNKNKEPVVKNIVAKPVNDEYPYYEKYIITEDNTKNTMLLEEERIVTSEEYEVYHYLIESDVTTKLDGDAHIKLYLGEGSWSMGENRKLIPICEYDLSNTDYSKEKVVDFEFNARNDMNLDIVLEKNTLENQDFGVYTFGGDVTVNIDNQEYTLEKALKNKLITEQNIVEQGYIDEKYRLCRRLVYADGGSSVCQYSNFSVAKYNSLVTKDNSFDYERDLVITFGKKDLNEINDLLEASKIK